MYRNHVAMAWEVIVTVTKFLKMRNCVRFLVLVPTKLEAKYLPVLLVSNK